MYNIRSGNIYKSFKEYDELISKYPKEIFVDINKYAHSDRNSKILEIGSGTGKATERMLDLKFNNITCIELEYELAAYMYRKFNGNINIDISSFEEWQGPKYKYDIIICANSFHFLDPKIRINKMKKILKKDGAIALFWTFEKISNNKISEEINNIYEKINYNLFFNNYDFFKENIFRIKNEIINKKTFYNFETKNYNWNKLYTVEEYINILNMNDIYYLLDESIKKTLHYDIRNILKGNNNIIKVNYQAILFLVKLI